MKRELTIQDRVKRAYQRAFGGGHMVADAAAALARMQAECDGLEPVAWEEPLFEPLGGGQCRMNLRPLLESGISLRTANAMFVYSANHTEPDGQWFEAELDALAADAADAAWIARYREAGCPATSHSEGYRNRYKPAYRVVTQRVASIFPLLLKMDAMGEGIVTIDGPCASGKSTLAAMAGEIMGAGVLHLDDYFLRPEQRTKERLAEPGGNVDRERFAREVLAPLQKGGDFTYHPFDCSQQRIGPGVAFARTPLVIVEGVYSLHPDLRDAYQLKVFVTVDRETELDRLLRRNGPEMLKRFETEWIPLEQAYFDAFDPASKCDLVLRM